MIGAVPDVRQLEHLLLLQEISTQFYYWGSPVHLHLPARSNLKIDTPASWLSALTSIQTPQQFQQPKNKFTASPLAGRRQSLWISSYWLREKALILWAAELLLTKLWQLSISCESMSFLRKSTNKSFFKKRKKNERNRLLRKPDKPIPGTSHTFILKCHVISFQFDSSIYYIDGDYNPSLPQFGLSLEALTREGKRRKEISSLSRTRQKNHK